jgi:hypothetical protein
MWDHKMGAKPVKLPDQTIVGVSDVTETEQYKNEVKVTEVINL